MLGVGAGDASRSRCALSADGPALDLYAPGCELDVALPDGSDADGEGTSLASAYVAAAATALRAYTGRSAADTEQLLLSTLSAGGMLDVSAAFRAAGADNMVIEPAGSGDGASENDNASDSTPTRSHARLRTPRHVKARWSSRGGLRVSTPRRAQGVKLSVSVRGANTTTSRRSVRMPVAKVRAVRVRYVTSTGRTSRWVTVRVKRVKRG